MPRETIKNRAGTFYARRSDEGQFSSMAEKGRSLASDRRTKAKTVAKKGEGDRGDQKRTSGGKRTASTRATAKKRTASRRTTAKKRSARR
ncbi:MAG: hypothetical protein AB1689_01685 [Thermodesulfobacteriota bacterium]